MVYEERKLDYRLP